MFFTSAVLWCCFKITNTNAHPSWLDSSQCFGKLGIHVEKWDFFYLLGLSPQLRMPHFFQFQFGIPPKKMKQFWWWRGFRIRGYVGWMILIVLYDACWIPVALPARSSSILPVLQVALVFFWRCATKRRCSIPSATYAFHAFCRNIIKEEKWCISSPACFGEMMMWWENQPVQNVFFPRGYRLTMGL